MTQSRISGDAPDVSFVLPVFNKADALPHFFASLLNQEGDFSREIIFVDDASTDGSLAVIEKFATAHDFVSVIRNDANVGPAIRLNQGAAQARGTYLALFDCDEVLAPDAISVMLDLALKNDADMVHGKGSKTTSAIEQVKVQPIGTKVRAAVFDNALERVLGRGMVRMTWLVKRTLFDLAGGCDEDVFIQDESLPLRLAFYAQRVVDADIVVTAIPDTGNHLSANKMQQHHDRFFVYAHFLALHHDLEADKCRKVFGKCLSAVRKAKRDGAPFNILDIQYRYFTHKAGLGRCDPIDLKRFESIFKNLPGIRRPIKP